MPTGSLPASLRITRRGALGAGALALPLLTPACVSSRLSAVPTNLTAQAQPAVRDIRFFPERDPEPFVREMLLSYDRERAALPAPGHTGPLPPAYYLTVSGGGGDGAYGAGLLV